MKNFSLLSHATKPNFAHYFTQSWPRDSHSLAVRLGQWWCFRLAGVGWSTPRTKTKVGNAKWQETAAAHFGGMLFPKSIFCVGNLGLEGFMSHFLGGCVVKFQDSSTCWWPFFPLGGQKTPIRYGTPVKLNIAREKWWLEDYFPFGMFSFQGLC